MKIAIVGGGINGLYLAWKLSEKKQSVTVFEMKKKIGKQICSGLFSERILKFFPESQKLIENEINYCLINFPKRILKIRFSKPFLIIDHAKLDCLAAKIAKKNGVKIILNKKINFFEVDNLKKEYDLIIGCDGATSEIRKNLTPKKPDYYLGIQTFTELSEKKDYVETWPTKSGFIWKIPKNQKTEWGIMEKPRLAKILFEEFLRNNSYLFFQRISGQKKNQLKLKAALIPQGLILSNDKRITLCGDSIGLTKPWSGGGVIWGLTAADFLLKNFPDFIKYQKAIRKFFLPKIILSKIIKKFVYFLGFKAPWIFPENLIIENDFLL